MEEVQSWWEVPAVAHFCYVFRSAFNLFYFEIAELESALLNIQDPDMSISLDQLIIRLLQGCYDEESVTEENWEEKLHDLFNENCEDGQNPFDDTQYFLQLTPRSKIEILLRLCEFRLDVEGALEVIKNIPSEDMQAKCMGKDSLNNRYWYFCDERLYKEDSTSGKKVNQVQKKKEVKITATKSGRQVNTREKRTKANIDIDKSWTIACFNVSDWEKLMKTFLKSKSSHEKELANAIKEHLPLLQERISEKDRLLRKRFMELAPKRTSSRISRVQEKKKLEEMKAQEEARIAKLEAEKEQARKEAVKLKKEKESRQMRFEMRHKAVEDRARRAKLREMARGGESDDSDSDSEDHSTHGKNENQKIFHSKTQRNQQNVEPQSAESEDSDNEKYDNGSDYEAPYVSHQRTSKRKDIKQYKDTAKGFAQDKNKRYLRTYSNYKNQSESSQIRVSSRLQSNPKTVKYRFDTDESEQDSDEGDDHDDPSETSENEVSTTPQQNRRNSKDQSHSEESDNEKDSDSNDESDVSDTKSDKTHNSDQTEDSVSMQNNSKTSAKSYSNESQGSDISLPRVTVYKTTLLRDSSDMSKWNTTLDSKGQKLHILNGTYDKISPKKLKLEQVKNFRTTSPNLKSSLSKENHIYQTPFITYGKIIPSSPSIVRLDFRKPPNHQVSS